jgi:ribose transport system substrate-binding protein
MKKIFVIIFLLFSFSILFSANNKNNNNKIKIGISIGLTDNSWSSGSIFWAKKSIDDWNKKTRDYEFILVTTDNSSQQFSQIEDLITKKVRALIVLPLDPVQITPICEKAKRYGIFIATADKCLLNQIEDVNIGYDNYGFGKISADFIVKRLAGRGKIVILEGLPNTNSEERLLGFKDSIKFYPDIELLDTQFSYFSTQKGYEIMDEYLRKYKQIDAVWAQDDDVLKGVIKACKNAGRKDIKIFLGGGGSKETLLLIMDKYYAVPGDISYSPTLIASAISAAMMAIREEPINNFYQKTIPAKIILRSEIITLENVKSYYFPDSIY